VQLFFSLYQKNASIWKKKKFIFENYSMMFIYFDLKEKDFAIKIRIKKKVTDMNIT